MELVVLSGKGGTGKTTIATALCELNEKVVRVDCDVDAPNLYLYYNGEDIEKKDFFKGKKATIDRSSCVECSKCEEVCRFDAIKDFNIDKFLCEGCGACTHVCEHNSIKLEEEKTAQTFITKLDNGIISRAEMEIGSDGSGLLISDIRKNAKKFNQNKDLVIIDGSPGIGCAVISSITGADMALIVTEPTKSGLEDLKRVVSLCEHFGILTMVCINKYDINEEMSFNIQEFIKAKNMKLVGEIPYDETVVKSINELKPITLYKNSKANEAIQNMWNDIKKLGGI
ncbi:ATP-binding protein [Tepidibacter hydrothermalis]|uniref:ATP-binding protein n=1 Tax=Tepidibacter hydrothermalis TaxID=3036126 RepID=A0ABY8E9N3_9FIRM|nr:ATP-binding protein [Tepidibacter hydrothermalis]WFD09594.1 ATP-binding protein [Tepidibacter hydrothermalis]